MLKDAKGQSGTLDSKNVTLDLGANTLAAEIKIQKGYSLTVKGTSTDNAIKLVYDGTDKEQIGYSFGWKAETTNDTITTATADGTVYTPNWTLNQYTISFDTAGGSAVDDIKQDFNTSVAAPTAPTKTGYTFVAWQDKDGKDVTFPVTMTAENITLTATWKANTYTIEFNNANAGSEGMGTMDNITATYGEYVQLPTNKFTKPNEFFAGWSLTQQGMIEYADEEEVINLTDVANGTVTLYANYSKLPIPTPTITRVTVTYDGMTQAIDLQDANGLTGYQITYTMDGESVEPINAGSYDINITRAADDDYAGYVNNIADGLVIEKAMLIATYKGETITVGQQPALEVEVTGFVNGETAETADNYVAPTVSTSETAIGTYSLMPTGGDATNYDFTYVAGDLVITKAAEPKPNVPYAITSGAKQTVEADKPATFVSNAELEKFVCVVLDGKELDEKNFILTEGSTKVTLKPEFVATLSQGVHTLVIVSTDGEAATTFTVLGKPVASTVPQTGDNSQPMLWLCLMAVSGVMLLVINRKRTKA